MAVIIDGTLGITTVNGSAAAPSVTGTDTDSGLYINSANEPNAAVNGSAVWNAVSTFGFKNRIINGAMVIDQRNAGAAWGTSINGYTVDRWQIFQSVTGKVNGGQNYNSITPPAGFRNYIGVQSQSAYSIGAGDYYFLQQSIEGYNVADLGFGTANAQPITLSFWVRSSLTGTFGLGFTMYNSGTASFRGYTATYTISAADTWEYKTVTIPGDTGGSGTWLYTNGMGLRVNFGLGVGSTYTQATGSWTSSNTISATGSTSVVGTSGATFYLTGVQLEKGSTATSFDYRPYGTELALCQRYYFKDLQDNTTATFLVGVIDSTTSCNRAGMRFPVQMRSTPTALYGGTTSPRIYDGNTTGTLTAITGNSGSSFGASLGLAASGGSFTIGRAGMIIDNVASWFSYSAEL